MYKNVVRLFPDTVYMHRQASFKKYFVIFLLLLRFIAKNRHTSKTSDMRRTTYTYLNTCFVTINSLGYLKFQS